MSDNSYLSCCSAAGPPPSESDKGQGGETVSDVTLPEDQTPFFPPLMWIMCEETRRYCTDWKQLLNTHQAAAKTDSTLRER